jgi:hypothetical protein
LWSGRSLPDEGRRGGLHQSVDAHPRETALCRFVSWSVVGWDGCKRLLEPLSHCMDPAANGLARQLARQQGAYERPRYPTSTAWRLSSQRSSSVTRMSFSRGLACTTRSSGSTCLRKLGSEMPIDFAIVRSVAHGRAPYVPAPRYRKGVQAHLGERPVMSVASDDRRMVRRPHGFRRSSRGNPTARQHARQHAELI